MFFNITPALSMQPAADDPCGDDSCSPGMETEQILVVASEAKRVRLRGPAVGAAPSCAVKSFIPKCEKMLFKYSLQTSEKRGNQIQYLRSPLEVWGTMVLLLPVITDAESFRPPAAGPLVGFQSISGSAARPSQLWWGTQLAVAHLGVCWMKNGSGWWIIASCFLPQDI